MQAESSAGWLFTTLGSSSCGMPARDIGMLLSNLLGSIQFHESVAIRRPRCRNRQVWQPVACRFERSSWKIINDRLGLSGACCDGRLALLCRASVLVFGRLASAVSCCRQIPRSGGHILASARRDRIRANTPDSIRNLCRALTLRRGLHEGTGTSQIQFR